MRRVSAWIAANITIIVVIATAVGLSFPTALSWMKTSWITPLLGIIMFGMGLTLKVTDFKPILKRPTDILIGEFAQFLVMPLIAWFLCKSFQLPEDLALGVVLVGCCPGGTASNVITFLAKGDIALSVCMTAVSTLLAPIVTPALVLLLAGKSIHVEVWGMFLSIIQVVIFPIVLGFIVNYKFKLLTEKVAPHLPAVSTLAITIIILIVVAHNADRILTCSLLVVMIVVLHNLFGLLLGFGIAKLFRLQKPKCVAISVEVGMQNSGLAAALAATHFAIYPMAAIPAAIFSAWHNFSGSIAAHIFRRRQE